MLCIIVSRTVGIPLLRNGPEIIPGWDSSIKIPAPPRIENQKFVIIGPTRQTTKRSWRSVLPLDMRTKRIAIVGP